MPTGHKPVNPTLPQDTVMAPPPLEAMQASATSNESTPEADSQESTTPAPASGSSSTD